MEVEMDKIIIDIHSVVDLITNSSTTIYTYQNCIPEAKELVQEMLNLSGIKDKTPDDIFYYGVFSSDWRYLDYINDEQEERDENEVIEGAYNIKAEYGTDEYKLQEKEQKQWFEELLVGIIKGEKEQPDWMDDAKSNSYSGYTYSTKLYLISKDNTYKEFGEKIKKILNGISADGGRDG
jgi:hypothetical protein